MSDLQRVLRADAPLTLAGAPAGFLPWLLADLARAASGRAVFIASDDAAMRGVAEAAGWFATEIEVIGFPAWDCLPYDRASPSLRATSERLAALHALQRKTDKPQLLVTTVNAITQRTLTPFRIRQLSASLAPGERMQDLGTEGKPVYTIVQPDPETQKDRWVDVELFSYPLFACLLPAALMRGNATG